MGQTPPPLETGQEAGEASPATATAAGKASTLGVETKRFGRSAAVYLAASLLVRGMNILLTPLYTRAMGPSDFAVVAVANAVASVLSIALGLCLSACIPRLSFEYGKEEQRAFFGTLLVLSLLVPLAFVGVLYALGLRGDLELFASVHFRPHLELVVWSSFFSVLMPLPLAVYNTREQPAKASLLGGASAVLQLAFTFFFVAVLRQGALGVLRANLLCAAATAALSAWLMARMSTVRWPLFGYRAALAFSLPLAPHLAANWVLAISDRLILDHYVPAADVGRYALGYTFNVLVSIVAAAIGNAFQPMAYRQLKDPATAANVAPLGTYAVLLILGFALGTALTAREALAIVAPPSYAGALSVVPAVVLGAVFQGIYLVLSTGTWFSMKTRPIALITLVGAGLNVALNLVFVPRYGMLTAAITTAVAYGVSAVLHGVLAHRLHPIAWEYRRWAVSSALALGLYLVGVRLPLGPIAARLVVKALIATAIFPLALLALGFFSKGELAAARRALTGRGRAGELNRRPGPPPPETPR
jgi:O-antigen/teichoic acid export membrane protein